MLDAELEACRRLADTGCAADALLRARALLARAEASGALEIAAAAARQLAWCCVQIGRPDDGLEPVRRAQRRWIELMRPREAADATVVHARLLFELGLPDEAYNEASEALRVARELDDVATQVFALDVQAITMIASGEMETGARLLDEAMALLGRHEDPSMRATVLVHKALMNAKIGDGLQERGDVDAARRHYACSVGFNEEAIAIVERIGDGHRLRLALTNVAEVYSALGDADKANERLDRWLAVPGAPGDSRMVHFLYTRMQLLVHSRRYREALEIGEEALALAERTGVSDHSANVHLWLSRAHEALSDAASALAHFKRFHLLDKKITSEKAQRQSRVAEALFEADKIRAQLDQAMRRADELAQEALLDPLTRIANRRALDRELLALSQKHRRGAYTIAIIDLDHFKSINDRFSHLVGDDVLRRVARVLVSSCRGGDLVARMGGEEFAVLLPTVARDVALEVCERIRAAIHDATWDDIAPGLSVTASLGVADSTEGATPLDIFAIADSRLYAAKAGGRNRVEFRTAGILGGFSALH